jgi:hypothetical protein
MTYLLARAILHAESVHAGLETTVPTKPWSSGRRGKKPFFCPLCSGPLGLLDA